MNRRMMDLSKPYCHICGDPLARDIPNLQEWCINPKCQLPNFKFSITYIDPKKA